MWLTWQNIDQNKRYKLLSETIKAGINLIIDYAPLHLFEKRHFVCNFMVFSEIRRQAVRGARIRKPKKCSFVQATCLLILNLMIISIR